MKLTTTILILGMTSGMAWAQAGPTILQNTKDKMLNVQEKKNADIGAALGNSQVPPANAQAVKPAPSQPAKAQANATAKPAATQVTKAGVVQDKKPAPAHADLKSKPAAVVVTKPAAKPAAVVVAKAPVKATPKAVKTQEAKSKKEATTPTTDAVSVESKGAPESPKNDKMKTITASGRRDPFISPVISQSATGSGCSTGKRCLAVDQISLKGVVKSETGMIAVVVNALDKAYFLRENDPVFDGYVLRITTDSIVFKETVQDKLGKPFTREVTKKITTPVV
jgi:hypothetical protein